MAFPGCVGSDPQDAVEPGLAGSEHSPEVIRMGAVDHVIGWRIVRCRVGLLDGSLQILPRRQPSVGFDGEGECDGHVAGACGERDADRLLGVGMVIALTMSAPPSRSASICG